MPSILLEIQETVMKYADIMSKVAQVEVEVVDENLFRVAGTGIFEQHVNEDMAQEGYVYEHLLRTGNVEIIYNPGKERLCQKCPKMDICNEEIEISMPIRLGGEIIGVIGLVGSTPEQKERVLSNEKMYLDLLAQIAEFIAVKAGELTESKKRAVLLDALDCVINHVEKGILILGGDNVVTMANEPAKRQLSVDMPEGQMAVVTPTGDNFSRQNEYKILLNGKEYFVMGHLYDLDQDPRRYSKVLIFESTREMQERFYEITNTVNPLSTFNIIGTSPQTRQMQEEIKKIARSTSTVLITGESGTGKELMAQSLHSASGRRNYPFVSINCAAIAPSLLESELFGYAEGAFTGSKKGGKTGLFEMADYGTLFLDEIGEASPEVQSKLLRAIETKEIMRIGGDRITTVDVRIIAATNRNLKEMVDQKAFRLDLYYRLNSIIIKIPPLRERKEDIRYLAEYFIYNEIHTKRQVDEQVWNFMEHYPWEGNVRELKNVVEYMVNITDGDLHLCDLPDYMTDGTRTDFTAAITDSAVYETDEPDRLRQILSETYSQKENRMILFILSLVADGVKNRREIGNKLAGAGEECTGYRLKKILENLRSLGVISFSRGPEGIHLEKSGQNLIKTHEIS